jgi:APA family basic amino acid/polyamine antiporter
MPERPDARHPAFIRELGLADAAVVVAGSIVGVGIFANPAVVAGMLGQPWLILTAWMLGGLVALLGGFAYAELGSRLPVVGGQYVYLARAYHPIVGFLYGVALPFIINGGALAAVAILFATYVDRTFVALTPLAAKLVASLVLIGLTGIHARGIRIGKLTNNTIAAAKAAGIVALIALAFTRGSSATNFAAGASITTLASSWQLLLTALIPIMFAYGGWQNCAAIAGEIKDPARNLAWANIVGVIAVVVLYLGLNVAYLWVLPPDRMAASTAVAAEMARTVAGDAGARFVSMLILVSALGFLAVIVLTGARLYYAMAVDGLLPRAVARLHPRYATPTVALWSQTAVSLVLLTTNRYDQLLSYVVFADWLFFGLTVAAIFRLRRRAHGDDTRLVLMPGHPYTTLVFVMAAAGIIVNSFVAYPAQSLAGSAILIAAIVVYVAAFGVRRDRKGLASEVS